MTAMMAYRSISRWSGALGVCAIVAIIRPAHADPSAVVELFTSQGCSACPPADKILGELAKDPNVIALSMPIDYWDYLGWKDTLADSRFSARQKAYSHMRGDRDVYTPQVIVNGATHVIGSDRERIEGAIKDTDKADGVMSVPVTMTLSGKQITVSVAASKVPMPRHMARSGSARSRRRCRSRSARGENRGTRSHLPQCGAQPCQGRRLERQSRKLDRSARKHFARRRRCRGRLRPGRQSRKAGPDAGRGLHAAALSLRNSLNSGMRVRRRPAVILTMVVMDSLRQLTQARAGGWGMRVVPETDPRKRKGPTLVGPVSGLLPLRKTRSRRPRGAGG